MHRRIILAAATSMTLAACTADDGLGGRNSMSASLPGDMTPEERTAYVRMAASSDLYEIQSSQIALARAQNPAIRSFAEMMVRDHSATSQQVMAAARAAGMPPITPQMMPMHANLVSRLQSASAGASFDRLYAQQQLMAHEQALALHSNYAANGDTPALRAAASAATPIVRGHLNMVQRWPR